MNRRPRILTFTCSFPNPAEPGHSLFVRSRMRHVAELTEVKVVAPVPLLDWGNPERRWFDSHKIPQRRDDGPLEVFHPRWLYPPLGTPWNIPCLYLQSARVIGRIRKEYSFDLIDSHFAYPDGVVAVMLARRFKCPSLITLRGNELDAAKQPWRRRSMKWALARGSRVIAVSEELRQLAISLGAKPERVRAIGNGIDATVFHPRDRAKARENLGIQPSEKVVLSAGSLIPRKGHHLVVEALGRLRDRGVRARLLIVGAENRDGRFARAIEATVERLGMSEEVRFLGFKPPEELAECMSAADLLCLASGYEGWPNVVHEALGCGCPVVSTRVGAVPDMLPSPEYGVVVPRREATDLAEAIGGALEKDWNRCAIADWGSARSWTRVAREVVKEAEVALAGGLDG